MVTATNSEHDAVQPPDATIRVAIIFDLHAHHDYAYQWARARVADLDRDLRQRGVDGGLVRIDIDGYPHLNP